MSAEIKDMVDAYEERNSELGQNLGAVVNELKLLGEDSLRLTRAVHPPQTCRGIS